jgi:DNA-directed RNA polymerase subunit RPC12/RpoP
MKKGTKMKTKTQTKITVRCRKCFMVDSYEIEEGKEIKCKHCGAKIYIIDSI